MSQDEKKLIAQIALAPEPDPQDVTNDQYLQLQLQINAMQQQYAAEKVAMQQQYTTERFQMESLFNQLSRVPGMADDAKRLLLPNVNVSAAPTPGVGVPAPCTSLGVIPAPCTPGGPAPASPDLSQALADGLFTGFEPLDSSTNVDDPYGPSTAYSSLRTAPYGTGADAIIPETVFWGH